MAILIYNEAGLFQTIKKVLSATIHQTLDGESTFEFSAIADPQKPILPGMTVAQDHQVYNAVRVGRSISGDISTSSVSCEHITYQLNNEGYNLVTFVYSGTPRNGLVRLLSGTPFSVGIVEPTTSVACTFTDGTLSRRNALIRFADACGGEIEYDGLKINIRNHRGTTDRIRLMNDENVTGVSVTLEGRENTAAYEIELYKLVNLSVGDELNITYTPLAINVDTRIVGISYNPYFRYSVRVEVGAFVPNLMTVREGTITGGLSVAASASDSSALSYQWYSNTTATNSGGLVIDGATSSSYAIDTSLSQGTYYYYCAISSQTADPVVSNAVTVTVAAPAVMLASYNLVGTLGGVASSYTDTSGNGNTLTPVGTVTYNGAGYPIVNAEGQALSLAAINLDGHTSYNIHMEINSTNGWNQQHRFLHVTETDLQFLLASSTARDPISGNAYQIVKLETTGGGVWSSENMLPYMYRPNFRRALIDISVTDDVVTIAFTAYDAALGVTTVTDSVQIEGFTAALASGAYLMNRFDGDRPLGGSLTNFYIETL